VSRHHLSLENFTGEFTVTNRTGLSVSFTDSMGSSLTREIPPFHSSLETFTFGSTLHVNKLSNGEVSRPQAVANGKEGFGGDGELSHVLLGRKVVLHEVTNLRLGNLMGVSAADSKLNSVHAVLFHCFNLSNLTSVHLYDGAWDSSSPFIPVVSHTNLIANQTSTLTFVSSRLALLKAVVGVDLSFETAEP